MVPRKIPVAGYPHLSLAGQIDDALQLKFLAALRTAGFIIEPARIVPPEGATSKEVIASITAAFQQAKAR